MIADSIYCTPSLLWNSGWDIIMTIQIWWFLICFSCVYTYQFSAYVDCFNVSRYLDYWHWLMNRIFRGHCTSHEIAIHNIRYINKSRGDVKQGCATQKRGIAYVKCIHRRMVYVIDMYTHIYICIYMRVCVLIMYVCRKIADNVTQSK